MRSIEETLTQLSVATPGHPVAFSFTENPKTDGKTIWLGAIDPNDDAFEALALGHGIHEMMHVKSTSIEALSAPEKLTPFLRSLINILEDIRIDSLGMAGSSCYALWREAMAEVLEERGQLAAQHPDSRPPLQQVCLWLHMELTVELPMEWAQRHLPALQRLVAKHLPLPLLDEMLQLARGARTAPDTLAVVKIAQTIESLLEKAASHKESSSVESEGRKASDNGTSPRPDRSFLQQALADDADDAPDLGLAYFMSATDQDAKASDQAGRSTPLRKAQNTPIYTVDPWPDPEAIEDRIARDDVPLFTKSFNKSSEQCRQLAQVFDRLFRTRDEDDDEASPSGPLPAADIALRVQMQDKRLFSSPAPRETVHGKIVILLDRSGSMGVTRMTSAKIAVAALWLALERESGIKRRIAVFPGLNQVHVGPLLRDGDTLEQFMTRFKSVNAFGSTPISEALFWAADRMTEDESEEFPNETRLILVVTDGDFPATVADSLQEKLQSSHSEIAVLSIAATVLNPSVASVTVRDDDLIPNALVELVKKTDFCQRLRAV